MRLNSSLIPSHNPVLKLQSPNPVPRGIFIRLVRQLWMRIDPPSCDRLLQELSTYETDDALAVWGYRSLPLKNTLTRDDAEAIEAAYLMKVGSFEDTAKPAPSASLSTQEYRTDASSSLASDHFVTPLTKPVRKRSKPHLSFVATQPCLNSKETTFGAHHLKIALPHSLGRKVSDEFTMLLYHKHHRKLHHHGNDNTCLNNMQIAPLPIAE